MPLTHRKFVSIDPVLKHKAFDAAELARIKNSVAPDARSEAQLRMTELKPCPFCGAIMDGGNEDG